MKKLILLLLTLAIISGCGNKESQDTAIQITHVVNNVLTINNADTVSPLIADGLKNKNIREIKASSVKPKPSDEQNKYFVRYFQLGNLQLALSQEKTLNAFVAFTPENDNNDLVGVWYASPTDTEWKRFIHIRNVFEEGAEARNNPFYIWNNKQTLGMLLIDDSGAGSGEGTAKVLNSTDNGRSWRISRCFYFAPELFPLLSQRPLANQKNFDDVINNYLKNKKSNLVKEFTLNKTTGNFEAEQLNKETGQIETIVQDGCHNIQVPYISE